jgi:hypothetical protein
MASALTKTETWSNAFKKTLPAAYKAKLRTAGMGTNAPRPKATVSVTELNRIDGPIFANVRATLSSADRYKGTEAVSTDSSCADSKGER